jgi:endonuclease YncB( thermonuclease family)
MPELDPKTLAETYARKLAEVIRVKDGDTILGRLDLGYYVSVTCTLRFRGIDAPEKGTVEAAEATDFLTRFLEMELPVGIYVVTHRFARDPYGRYLADLYTAKGASVNQLLLDSGFAVPYKPR